MSTITLHPLVLLSLSDHATRNTILSNTQSSLPLVGALLGIINTTSGDHAIDIRHAFDLIVDQGTLSSSFLAEKMAQYKTILPECELVGWYWISGETSVNDLPLDRLFAKMAQDIERPIFLHMNSSTTSASDGNADLPIQCYEVIKQFINDGTVSSLSLSPQGCTLTSDDAERIALNDLMAAHHDTQVPGAGLVAHLTTQRNAIAMLYERISMIESYLTSAARDGTLSTAASHHTIMREIRALCMQLSSSAKSMSPEQSCSLESTEGETKFTLEGEEPVMLMNYLSSLTKQLQTFVEVKDRFSRNPVRIGPGMPRKGLAKVHSPRPGEGVGSFNGGNESDDDIEVRSDERFVGGMRTRSIDRLTQSGSFDRGDAMETS